MSEDSGLYLKLAYSVGVDSAVVDFGLGPDEGTKEARIGFGKALTDAGLKLAPEIGAAGRVSDDLLAQMSKGVGPNYATFNSRLSDDMLKQYYGNYGGGINRVGNPAYKDSMRAANKYVNQARKAVPSGRGTQNYRPSRLNPISGNRPLSNEQLAGLGLNPGHIVSHPLSGRPVAVANLSQSEMRVLLSNSQDAVNTPLRQTALETAQSAVRPRNPVVAPQPQQPGVTINPSAPARPAPPAPPPAPPAPAPPASGLNNPNSQMDLLAYRAPPPRLPMRGAAVSKPSPLKAQVKEPPATGNTVPASPTQSAPASPTQPATVVPQTAPSFGARFGVPLAAGGLAAGAGGAGYMYGTRNQDQPLRNVVRHYTGY